MEDQNTNGHFFKMTLRQMCTTSLISTKLILLNFNQEMAEVVITWCKTILKKMPKTVSWSSIFSLYSEKLNYQVNQSVHLWAEIPQNLIRTNIHHRSRSFKTHAHNIPAGSLEERMARRISSCKLCKMILYSVFDHQK